MYVVELDLAGIVNVLCLVVVEDVCVLDGDVVNHTFCSVGNDTVLAADSWNRLLSPTISRPRVSATMCSTTMRKVIVRSQLLSA